MSYTLFLQIHPCKSSVLKYLLSAFNRTTIRARYSPYSSAAEWKNDPPFKHQGKEKKRGGERENEHRRVGTAPHVARVYTPNWIACLGLSDTWGNLTKSKLNWSAKWKPADWLSAQLSVNASPLGFYPLLQTLQNYYFKKTKQEHSLRPTVCSESTKNKSS